MASAPNNVDVVETEGSYVKEGVSFAESAGGGSVKPLTNNNDKKVEINKDIKTISDVSNIKGETKSVSNIKSVREFYVQYINCFVKYYNETKDVKSPISFRDFMIKYYKDNMNTGVKFNSVQERSIIVFPVDKEKDSLGSFKLERDTLQISDFNNIIPTEKEVFEDNQEVISVHNWYDGPSIILSVKNGKFSIRTSKTFFADGNFDDSMSHKDRFFDICKNNGINMDALLDYSKSTPEQTYCLHIIMDINYAPFPKSKENTLVLNKVYIINDKSENLAILNTKMSNITSPDLSNEEVDTQLQDITKFIETELSFDYINEKDVVEMISFLTNIGFGELLNKVSYSFDPSISFKDQATSLLKVMPYDTKGLVVWDTMSKKYELINPNYEYVENLRIKNLPINIGFEEDGSLSKFCQKKMFILFLHLIYNMNKQRSLKGIDIKREDMFSTQFYRYYDKETMLVDGVAIGKYSHVLKNIIRSKVGDWFKFLFETYINYVKDKKEINLQRRTNPKYFKKLSFPRCFTYYDYEHTHRNKNGVILKGKELNFIVLIQEKIYKPNIAKNKRYRVSLKDIEIYFTENVFIKYYEKIVESIANGTYKEPNFTFDKLHNLILNPIKTPKTFNTRPSLDDV